MCDPHVLLRMALFSRDASIIFALLCASKPFAMLARNHPEAVLWKLMDVCTREVVVEDYDSEGSPFAAIKSFFFEFWERGYIEQGEFKCTVLPSGIAHSIEDNPSAVSDVWRGWFKGGLLHRDGDKPAEVHADGSMAWYKHGKEHRDEDNPAYIDRRGLCKKIWYKNGEKHRDGDKPAVTSNYGDEWWQHGIQCRDGDKPAVIMDNYRAWYNDRGVYHRDGDNPAVIDRRPLRSSLKWYKNGRLHRDGDKPAVLNLHHHKREWYKHGCLHRDGDKPAVICSRGDMCWYKNGTLHRDGDKPTSVTLSREQCLEESEELVEGWREGLSVDELLYPNLNAFVP